MTTSTFQRDVPAALLNAAQRGEHAALEKLYRLFERPVYTLALRLLGGQAQALDALQDSFMRAFEQLPKFRGDAPFWAWLRMIAVNRCLGELRQVRPEALTEQHLDEPAGAQRLTEGLDLQRSLQQLPERTRAVLWLYFVEGYDHNEIAEFFGQSPSFSKSQVARGSEKLRNLLQSEVSKCPTPSLI